MPSRAGDSSGRRQNPRVGCVLRLQYRNAGHLLVSYCTNLSRGGLFVATDQPLAKGRRVTLAIQVPGQSELVHLDAYVRWTRKRETDSGPPGMGLSFDAVDAQLGDWIDRIVSDFAPLRVEIVGDPTHAWRHISALLRSLVTCETHHRPLDPGVAGQLEGADLVIIDFEPAVSQATRLLQQLSALDHPPPILVLVSERVRASAPTLPSTVRTIHTPVDSNELQTAVLDLLGQVRSIG